MVSAQTPITDEPDGSLFDATCGSRYYRFGELTTGHAGDLSSARGETCRNSFRFIRRVSHCLVGGRQRSGTGGCSSAGEREVWDCRTVCVDGQRLSAAQKSADAGGGVRNRRAEVPSAAPTGDGGQDGVGHGAVGAQGVGSAGRRERGCGGVGLSWLCGGRRSTDVLSCQYRFCA